MIFVPYAKGKGVDTVIQLNTSESGFKDGYDRLVYIGTHFPSTLVAFVRRAADGTEEVLTSPAVKLACALKAGENLPGGRDIVDDKAGRTVEAYVSYHGGEIPSMLDFDRLLEYATIGTAHGLVAGTKVLVRWASEPGPEDDGYWSCVIEVREDRLFVASNPLPKS